MATMRGECPDESHAALLAPAAALLLPLPANSDYFFDILYDTLNYTLDGNSSLLPEIDQDNILSIQPQENLTGSFELKVRGTNPQDSYIESSGIIQINGVNDPPWILSIPDIISQEGDVITFEPLEYILDSDSRVTYHIDGPLGDGVW